MENVPFQAAEAICPLCIWYPKRMLAKVVVLHWKSNVDPEPKTGFPGKVAY